jgi:hypothetical protein
MSRCCVCNKKIRKSLYDALKCKCGVSVCKKHRYPDQHNCNYDFRKENEKKLREQMPKVECDKVIRI